MKYLEKRNRERVLEQCKLGKHNIKTAGLYISYCANGCGYYYDYRIDDY